MKTKNQAVTDTTDTPILVHKGDAERTLQRIQSVADSLNQAMRQYEVNAAAKLSHSDKTQILKGRKYFDVAKYVGTKFNDLPHDMRLKARQEVARHVVELIDKFEVIVKQRVLAVDLEFWIHTYGRQGDHLHVYRGEIHVKPETEEIFEKLSTHEIRGDQLKAFKKAEKGLQMIHESKKILGRSSPDSFITNWKLTQRDFVSPPDIEL